MKIECKRLDFMDRISLNFSKKTVHEKICATALEKLDRWL
ncbi:hypothetical protein CACET_c23850 [Clostridium aceticum]|uniref:Uncharacterized protein n=1 Tax=Clostridium aceticum TaxID=84022 RepID=A0A0G3WAY5_9CLOT|nr:hypothetical protein CACET_c23850 [Clostridium aceticum]